MRVGFQVIPAAFEFSQGFFSQECVVSHPIFACTLFSVFALPNWKKPPIQVRVQHCLLIGVWVSVTHLALVLSMTKLHSWKGTCGCALKHTSPKTELCVLEKDFLHYDHLSHISSQAFLVKLAPSQMQVSNSGVGVLSRFLPEHCLITLTQSVLPPLAFRLPESHQKHMGATRSSFMDTLTVSNMSQRTYRTNCLLDQLIDRVAYQSTGPRAIGVTLTMTNRVWISLTASVP